MFIHANNHSYHTTSCRNRKYYRYKIDTDLPWLCILVFVCSSWTSDNINFPLDISYQHPIFDSRCRKGLKSRVLKMMSFISRSMSAREKMSARTFICRQNHDNSVSYHQSSTQNVGDASWKVSDKNIYQWEKVRISENIWEKVRIYENIWEYVRISENIWEYLTLPSY